MLRVRTRRQWRQAQEGFDRDGPGKVERIANDIAIWRGYGFDRIWPRSDTAEDRERLGSPGLERDSSLPAKVPQMRAEWTGQRPDRQTAIQSVCRKNVSATNKADGSCVSSDKGSAGGGWGRGS